MALLRCPACNSRGEVIDDDPKLRFRCTKCGHRFAAGDANPTREYNIFAEDLPLFLADEGIDLSVLSLRPGWISWLARFAKERGLSESELVRQALVAHAKGMGYSEPPPVE